MKCPNCGEEFKEERLYCEHCGHEIQIVPDFEPEIENRIYETLSNLAEELQESDTADVIKEDEEVQSSDISIWETLHQKRKNKPVFFWGVISICVIIMMLLVFLGIKTFQNQSYHYQVDKALSYGQDKEYKKAIPYLEKALSINSENKDVQIVLADYYSKSGNDTKAIAYLKNRIASGDNKSLEAYKKLISIYEKHAKYEEINQLLLNCDDSDICSNFNSYMAIMPDFSLKEGTYFEVVPLKISANTAGTIYYTTDGSTPDKNSLEYTAPIFLEEDSYTISAIFINEYGVSSEVESRTYKIEVATPYPPEINLYSGLYTSPQKIELIVPENGTVYYTVDGTDPTQNSSVYVKPIWMPLGNSFFKFVTYSQDGVAGNIVDRSYNLSLTGTIQKTAAINKTINMLLDSGFLSDAKGHKDGLVGNYSYECTTAIAIDDQMYFLIIEKYLDVSGIASETGNQYAVNIMSSNIYQAVLDQAGNYTAVEIPVK